MNSVVRQRGVNDFVEYIVIDEKEKQIEMTYKEESIIFDLVKKRSFVVLKELLKRYPSFMNIHDLDGVYHDPNRALSDLRHEDGFEPFIDVERREKQVMYVRVNVAKLFTAINKKTSVIRLAPYDRRESISEKDKQKIFKDFKGKCNITGVTLRYSDDFDFKDVFMKNLQLASFDHRKPLVKTGSNDRHNWQLVSRFVNQEKNKICNACILSKCNTCALAHPEKVTTIHPTGQDISILRYNGYRM